MVGVGGAVSSLLSLGANLLHAVASSPWEPQPTEGRGIEDDLRRLMRTAGRIRATLHDAEEREMRDESFRLRLKELREVARDAEDVLDEYHYEVLRAQAEARDGTAGCSSCKGRQIQVPHGMADRIRKITQDFNDIAHDWKALELFKEDGPRRDDAQIAPTSHMVADSGIFGRQTEKDDIVNLLCSECDENRSISVVTVVGTGGIGKTTLAQLVYIDRRIQQAFDQFGWVYVSDSFDVKRLTREAIESISEIGCDMKSFSALQKRLGEVVRDKRLFLVLDDVWNESTSLWESFRIPLMSAKLVKILVTTRYEHAARIMRSVTIHIEYLSEEECWQLFQYYAFDEVNRIHRPSKFVELGKKIIEKCGRLPLAVKSVASLLRHEADESNWNEILESEIWQWDVRDEILRPLQISYSRLPTQLKPCFLFCSIFPKNYEFKIEELAQFWIAHGYIGSYGAKSREEIAWQCAKQLWQRSFFDYWHEDSEFQLSTFKLHDMVHELAIINSADECYSFQAGKVQAPPPKKICHLRVGNNVEEVKFLPASSCTGLRTLIVGYRVEKFSASSLSEVKTLRALEFKSECCDLQLFRTIENLKHLRYLKLESFSFERLPESFGLLYNLQYLTLSRCSGLFELPNSIGNLVNLQSLILSHCCELHKLPECIGNLLGLETLILASCGIGALPASLCQLTVVRKIMITDCRNLSDLPHDLGNLTGLRTLIIKSTGVRYLPRSLNNVTGLENLVLNYGGDE